MAGQPWYSLSSQLPLKWMSQGAIQYANDKVRGDVPAQKELMKLENVLIKHNNSSPNLTIQKRVTQALLVKGLPKKRMESLQQEGRFHIGGQPWQKVKLFFRTHQACANTCES